MRFYVTKQGTTIVKQGDRLLVKKGEDIYHTMFLQKVEQIIILGNVSITPQARRAIFKQKIDTVFLTQRGSYVGRYNIEESKNFFLRKKQFECFENKDFILNIAKTIVKAKMFSQISLLMRIGRTKNKHSCKNKAEKIKKSIHQLEESDSLDSVRGYEGKASAIYFSGFSEGFVEDMGFRRRIRRPPTDPVNSVLSILYTFLFNRVYSAVRAANLDPYVGSLHSPDYGRFALVMDLMEEFRVIICDTLCLSLFNLGILKSNDFVQITSEQEDLDSTPKPPQLEDNIVKDKFGLMSANNPSEFFDVPEQRFSEDPVDYNREHRGKLPVQLTQDALKKVISAFEKKLQTEFYYEPIEKKISYQKAIFEQARMYRRVIEGQNNLYTPLVLK